MTRIYEIANRYVDQFAGLHPIAATFAGISGHDDRMTDYSPGGHKALADLARDTLADLNATSPEGDLDRVARDAIAEDLTVQLRLFDAEEHLRDLNVIASPFQAMRQVFDLMPRQTEADWRNIAVRLRLVRETHARYRESLSAGLSKGLAAAQRQAVECGRQARVWSGQESGTPPYFGGLLEEFRKSGVRSDSLRRDLERGVADATASYAETGRYLTETYLPKASPRDPAGQERYALKARAFCGMEIDHVEIYRWGWDQLRFVRSEMDKTAKRILPGRSLVEAREHLDKDAAKAIEGVDRFRDWMQEFIDRTIADLDGVHFDIPGPVKRIEAMIAPPGGALAMYYTSPSEDFSRPGRMWWPVDGKARFPLWHEITTVYHEGVPGHHFQIGYTVYLATRLSRYQRLLGGTSGHAEGWALYSERLMGELGYLENPDFYLGMLSAQALRCVRVIIDIGMHHELKIPGDAPFHPGETWTPDLGLQFALDYTLAEPDFLKSEIDRYLGWPGQAISYKVGERVWLAAREDAKRRMGARFDLKKFHTRALELGPMGLAQLEQEVKRL
ncbi:MAG: DUF885 domain-containing protein [Chloroflexi bacterium]|nr:DUF885 domain-containing protein [Chloroflexota bacterium]